MKKIIIFLLSLSFLFLNKSEIVDNQQFIGNTNHCEKECKFFHYEFNNYNPNDEIIIVGLGDVPRERLIYAEQVIKQFYKFHVQIRPYNYNIENQLYTDGTFTTIDCEKFIKRYDSDKRVLFLTNKEMRGNVSPSVRGYTTLNGKIIISTSGEFLKETVTHEIGHTYGLGHCGDLSCVMAVNNDQYDSGTFCNNCRRTINYR